MLFFLGVGWSTGRGTVPDDGVGPLAAPSGEIAICEDGQWDAIGGRLVVAGVDSGFDGLLGVVSVALDENGALEWAHGV